VVERARIVDLYSGKAGGYYRDSTRYPPGNLYVHGHQLLAETDRASTAQDIGFRFGPALPGGTPAAAWSVTYPATSFTFRWSAQAGRWLVWMDGAPARSAGAGQLAPATVVVEHTAIGTSRFPEQGGPPPFAHSTGDGRAVVLRDGQAWRVNWARPHGSSGTTFKTSSGQGMTFARGPVWVVLARE
jgi:hypothetical protein